jgi:hypothetical protein
MVELHVIGKILSAVQRRERPRGLGPEHRKMHIIDMKVQDVEFVGSFTQLIEHHHLMRDRIADRRVKPQRMGGAGHEFGSCNRIAAGKQRDLMTLRYQFLGQIGNHPLGTAIEARRHALEQRSNLCNPHAHFPCTLSNPPSARLP